MPEEVNNKKLAIIAFILLGLIFATPLINIIIPLIRG